MACRHDPAIRPLCEDLPVWLLRIDLQRACGKHGNRNWNNWWAPGDSNPQSALCARACPIDSCGLIFSAHAKSMATEIQK